MTTTGEPTLATSGEPHGHARGTSPTAHGDDSTAIDMARHQSAESHSRRGCAPSAGQLRPIGIRDYAILMLVARLGLRSVEVVRLEFDDIDWRIGQIVLRGEASRQDGMPLPWDAGEALAPVAGAYLEAGAAGVSCCEGADTNDSAGLGQRRHPPGLRQGWDPENRCASTAALVGDRDVAAGASMVKVSQLLRHRDLATTTYARVNFATRRGIAQAWPGSVATRGRPDRLVSIATLSCVFYAYGNVLHRGIAVHDPLDPAVDHRWVGGLSTVSHGAFFSTRSFGPRSQTPTALVNLAPITPVPGQGRPLPAARSRSAMKIMI